METDRVIESKYWPDRDSYGIRFASPKALNELVDELKACKYVMEQEGLEKVCLIFGKKVLDDNEFNGYMLKLRDVLGGDTGWLIIYNGFEEYKSKG